MTSDVFGTDEAGKGPVLGSMFAAAVAVPDPGVLPDGIDDSKRLAPDRRARLAAELRDDDRVAIGVAEIPVARIDDPGTDMNTLTVAAHAGAVSDVTEDCLSGVADAGDASEERFARRVRDAVGTDIAVEAEHGADETYAVVGAASIVAKVERDAHVERLADEYGERFGDAFDDLGSGYPSDPTTREFLREYVREYGELPDCARTSWQTSRDVLAANEQSALGEF